MYIWQKWDDKTNKGVALAAYLIVCVLGTIFFYVKYCITHHH